MAQTSVGAGTSTLRLRVTLRNPRPVPTITEFANTLRDVDSLLFVSALLTALDVEAQHDPLQDRSLFPSSPVGEGQLYSTELITAANAVARSFRVEQVTYQSPVEMTLAVVRGVIDSGGPYVLIPAFASLTANQAILLWRSVSKGRLRHAEADRAVAEARKAEVDLDTHAAKGSAEARIAEANARRAEADARLAEAEARIKESEAAVRIEANNIIRGRLGVVQTIFTSGPMSNRTGPYDSSISPESVMARIDQAVEAVVSIDNIRFDDNPT